jgi:hypothetical protein
MPVILTTQRQRSGGSWFKVSPNSKKITKKGGRRLVEWLKA